MANLPASLPRFLAAGDHALLVEFGEAIDLAINARVHALDAALQARRPAGLVETVPTYRSVMLVFDPAETDSDRLRAAVEAELALSGTAPAGAARRWKVPVAYGGEEGIDLDDIAKAKDMTTDEVVRLHGSAEYVVYMIGFSPGFAYLGGLPEALHTPRRLDPRARTPAGSVMIGGQQACISPTAMPSGWHILGQTAVRAFAPERGEPFLFRPGDRIRFDPVPVDEHRRLLALPDYLPPCEPLA